MGSTATKTVLVRAGKKSSGNKGNKNAKYGRNKKKCQDYRSAGKQAKNKRRKWEGLVMRWTMAGIKEKEAAFLQGKIDRREYAKEG